MLIETGAIKIRQPIHIPGKMRRNPVQYHPNPRLVQSIDKIHKILRRPVSGCGCIIPNHLISPGCIKGMLHHGHQLHMSITHFLNVRNQPVRNLTIIGIRFALRSFRKGTKIQFINTDRYIPCLKRLPVLEKVIVFPFKAFQVRNNRSCLGTKLRCVPIRIRL